MHSIHFIHMDIKKDNVAFSNSFNKYVFIDFGLSKLIRQNHNEKTLTKF
jgi:serine/threonine protein kinase